MNLLLYFTASSLFFLLGCSFKEYDTSGRAGLSENEKMKYDFFLIGKPPEKPKSFKKTQISRIGPKPSEAEILNQIQVLSNSFLHDPSSAKWKITTPLVKGWMNHGKWYGISGTYAQRGYQTYVYESDVKYGWNFKGKYNAKNQQGTYNGYQEFFAQWVNGEVLMLDLNHESMNLHYIKMDYLSLDDFMGQIPSHNEHQTALSEPPSYSSVSGLAQPHNNSTPALSTVSASSTFKSELNKLFQKFKNKEISPQEAMMQMKDLKLKYGR